MKKLKPNFLFIALALLVALTSCRKNKITPATSIATAPNNIYILNQLIAQGGVNTGSNLSYYNIASKTLIADQYSAVNGGTQLAGINNIGVYGSKLYIVGYSGVVVTDVKTSKLIKQVNFVNFKYSAHIAFYNGDAFVSGGTSIAVIDTATFAIKSINVSGSVGLAVANNKLYATCPGSNGEGNLVFVIDLTTLTVTKSIPVIPKPIGIAADANGNVYVLSPFDDDFIFPAPPLPANYPLFDGFTGGMTIIDSKTDQQTATFQSQQVLCNSFSTNAPIAVCGDFVYFFNIYNKIIVFNTKTHNYTGFFVTDGTVFNNPSSIAANPATGEVFVGDSKNTSGAIYAFDKTGKLEYLFTTAGLPVQIALVHN
jgi:YVTN family beta-propeller protein